MTKPNFANWIDTDNLKQDKLAEGTYYNLTEDLENLQLPDIPWDKLKIPDELLDALQKAPRRLTIQDLTSRVPKGEGVFDALMETCYMHLKEEHERGRISGAEYTKAYIQSMTAALQGAIQFLTTQDSMYWQTLAAQLAAIKGCIEIYTLMVQYYIAEINVCLVKAQYAAGKISLALSQEQIRKVREEMEHTRAQTIDTRTDGTPIGGIIAKQKTLYDEQATAYKRNTEIKTVGVWMDGYSVNKTTDEGLLPPDNLTNSAVDSVMSELKSRVFNQD